MPTSAIHPASCACCGDVFRGAFSRRGFLAGALASTFAGAAATTLSPLPAFAARRPYEAMVLACIDPRMQEPVRRYMARRGLTKRFSHFVIAGSAVGVVAEPFKDWRKAFWDNLATSIEIHHITRVIAINHRDCGAARIAYGAGEVATPKLETQTHREALGEFRKQVAALHPRMKVETGLMAIDGRIEMFT